MFYSVLALASLLPTQAQEPPQLSPVAASLVLQVTQLDFDSGQAGRFPSLSTDGAGDVHLSWFTQGETQGKTLLRHSRWSKEAWSVPRTLAQGENWLVNWADFARYREDAQGNAIACWQTFSADKRGYGVTQRMRAGGQGAWLEAASLHVDQKAVEHGFVSLVPLGDGRFFATWLQSTATGPPTQLRANILNVDGTVSQEQVLDELICDCCGTAAVVLPSGEVVVAYRDRSADEIRDLRIVRGNPSIPASWSKPTAVDKEGWKTFACPVNGPAMANDGDFISLVYYTEGTSGFKQVKFVTSKDGGKSFSFPLPIAGGPGCLGRVSVAQMPRGGPAIVSWLQQSEGTAHWVAMAIPRQGKASDVVKIAEVSGSRADGFLQLAASSNGILAAWTASNEVGKKVRIARITY